jgi:hypothetical protein
MQESFMSLSRIAPKAVLGAALLLLVVLAQAAGPGSPGKRSKSKATRAVAPVVLADPVMEPLVLTDEDKALIERVSLGNVACELGARVSLTMSIEQPGRFVLEHNQRRFHMVATPTTTGAVRLEDAAQGAVWLQLANKSMLMDQKNGRRLADACMNAAQTQVAQAMERSPAPGLLDPLPAAAQAPETAAVPSVGSATIASQSAAN